MSDDVTIPREAAQQLADFLLRHGLGRHHHLVKLLDQPQPSLRDVVAHAIREDGWTCDFHEPEQECRDCEAMTSKTADRVLAVVRKHIEGLPTRPLGLDCRVEWMARDDVLALLGGDCG